MLGADVQLSIITINLNNAKGLLQTFKSIDKQIYNNFECVIIDGNSSDESIEIIKSYEPILLSKNISFCWISEKDKGIYHAMNKGIIKASGKYCFFLNSGDWFANDHVLESIFKTQPTEGIVFGNLKVVNPDKSIKTIYGKKNLTFMDLYMSNVVKHQSAFIKTRLFYQHEFYNEDNKIVSDWEFFLKVLGFKNVSYRYINVIIAFFDNNGISNYSDEICKYERESVIKHELAPLMRLDYEKWSELRYLESALQYKWSSFLLRIVSKLAKEISKIMRKR